MKKPDIPIIFENQDILVINKPSGLSVTADRGGQVNLIEVLNEQINPSEPLRLIHRLDKDTSGVLALAKNRTAQSRYCRLFGSGAVRKLYLAIVNGPVGYRQGWIKAPLAISRKNQRLMQVNTQYGKPAATFWKKLADLGRYALLAVEPITGRTHQIRVHLSHQKMPLAIDPLYGQTAPLMLSAIKKDYKFKKDTPEIPLMERLTLHAYQIALPLDTETNTMRLFIAPLDKKFLACIKQLAKYTLAEGTESAFEDASTFERLKTAQPLEFSAPDDNYPQGDSNPCYRDENPAS